MGSLISNVGGLLGGTPQGQQFTAGQAQIAAPTTAAQANAAAVQAQSGLNQQQQLANALAAQNGIGNQSAVYNQLQGVANGQGPNPAMAQLNQTTGQNIQNQAALMAGQRGASANPALIARQAAQQGAATQQQAVGQGATMQAQQSLAALGQLGGIAGQQVAQQQGAVTGLNAATQAEQGQVLGALGAQNTANIQAQSNQNSTNQAMAAVNANNTSQAIGGALSGAASTAGLFAHGGEVENPKLAQVPAHSRFGSGAVLPPHLKHVATLYHGNKFGDVQSMPKYGNGNYAHGGEINVDNGLKQGGKVPGKAKASGDHEFNDTVKAKLSPGEVVIPKSVMESDDPVNGAAQFVANLHKQKNEGSGNDMENFKDALKRAAGKRKAK